jgi:uncharacterized UPF0160 family protein
MIASIKKMEKDKMSKVPDHGMTHGGKFHADDVFSTALLKIINPNIQIIRGFQVPENFDGIVYDIGYGKYDHHQENAEIRDNGIPYAAFGLLWREFGESLVGAEEATRFDEKFIQQLDEDDNTGCGSPLARVIGMWNPNWDSEEQPDQCFQKAEALAEAILKKEFDSIFSIQRAKSLVEAALANSINKIVVLPQFAPWRMVLVPSDAEFVVYPSQRGGFSAQVIPADFNTKDSKCDFPQEWAGKSEAELKSISGVETLTFCHNNRFLISADTLEDTIKACKIAQELNQKENRKEKNNE